ncbi:MAG: hypothetical protein HWE13_11560 [Gammaproteobacteria bacterium]|nr:hypothetical protein [Gammaproteobacteria bacterium]
MSNTFRLLLLLISSMIMPVNAMSNDCQSIIEPLGKAQQKMVSDSIISLSADTFATSNPVALSFEPAQPSDLCHAANVIIWRSQPPAAERVREWLNVAVKQGNQWHLALNLVISEYHEQYGGSSYLTSFSVLRETHSVVPSLRFSITSLPAKDDDEFRPGPPLTQHYRYDEVSKQYKLTVNIDG